MSKYLESANIVTIFVRQKQLIMKSYKIFYSFSPHKTENPKYEQPIVIKAENVQDAFKKAKEVLHPTPAPIIRMYAKH